MSTPAGFVFDHLTGDWMAFMISCFIAFSLVFIIRLLASTDEILAVRFFKRQLRPVYCRPVHVPFALNLTESFTEATNHLASAAAPESESCNMPGSSSVVSQLHLPLAENDRPCVEPVAKNKITIRLSCTCDASVRLLWFVPYAALFNISNVVSSKYDGYATKLLAGLVDLTVSLPANFALIPLSVYPLVVVLDVDQSQHDRESPLNDSVVICSEAKAQILSNMTALIAVLHLKNVLNSEPNRVLHRFIRYGSHKFSLLQAFFVDKECDDTVDTLHSSADTGVQFGECVVCLSRRSDSVLLPCGHACLCSVCFESIAASGTCPVCRTVCTHYWRPPLCSSDSQS